MWAPPLSLRDDSTRCGHDSRGGCSQSGRFDAVVAAGGDGTVHDAAEGVVGHSTPLGFIPMGTGNVFAREINIFPTPDEIARTLLNGKARAIPIGQVNGRPFLFVIGVGFDAEAVRLFESEGSREFGRVGFVWPVLRALSSHKDRLLRIGRPRRSRGTMGYCDKSEALRRKFIADPRRRFTPSMLLCASHERERAIEPRTSACRPYRRILDP